jgi:CRP-like cAMP-binding protein
MKGAIAASPSLARTSNAPPLGPPDSMHEERATVVDAGGMGAGRKMHFPPRALIFLEGDLVDWVYQIEFGTVMLYKLLPDGRRQVVELLGAGDIFGFSPAAIHHCTAETLAPTACVAFDRTVIERSPDLMRRLNARLYAQLCAMHDLAMLLGRKSAMERIASFLMRCVPGRGGLGCPGPRAGEDRETIRITMTRQEMADYLGLTIETVSRNLSKLKRLGLVSIRNLDEICIQDVCRLCRLTGTHLTHGHWCSSREDSLIKDPWQSARTL